MEGVVIVNRETNTDASTDVSMDTSMNTSMDIASLKRKAADISGDDNVNTLLKDIITFSEELEKWEDTWDANWINEEMERVTSTARKVLASMNAEGGAKKATVDASIATTTTPTTNLDVLKLAASVVRIMSLARTTEGSLSGVPSVDRGVVKDLFNIVRTCDKLLRALGVAIPDGYEYYLEKETVFQKEPHDLMTDEEIMATLVPIVTATEITLAPPMSMTLLENGKDIIVKAAKDSANNAYRVLFYGPKEMNDEHRIALRDIAADNLKILNIVGVPFKRESAHYPYVDKVEDAKEIIDAWSKGKANEKVITPAITTPATTPAITTPATTTPAITTSATTTLSDAARKMIVASAIQTIKDTVATFDNSCNLEEHVRQRLHNTVVNQKEILDNLGEPHPEGLELFV